MRKQVFCDVGNTAIDLLLEKDGHSSFAAFYPEEEDKMLAFLGKEEGLLAYVSSVSSSHLLPLRNVLERIKAEILLLDRERMKNAAKKEKLAIDNLDILGQDLFCDILGAGKNHIVIDCGTATKILAIDDSGLFLGGAILPGIPAFPKALSLDTELLPRYDLKMEKIPLLSLETKEAILSGAVHGTSYLLEGYLERIRKLPGMEKAQTITTGGNFPYLFQDNALWKENYRPELPLLGLRKAFLG